MEKYSFIDSYPKNLFSLLHIFLCGMMPNVPSRPRMVRPGDRTSCRRGGGEEYFNNYFQKSFKYFSL